MKLTIKYLILILIVSCVSLSEGTAQTNSIKATANWQATKTTESTLLYFQPGAPNYFSIAVFQNKNKRIHEAGISFWNLKNSEVLNFNFKERNVAVHYGYGWDLVSFKEEKIKVQLVNSLRVAYESLKNESKFFETVYDRNSSIGAAILINPRVNYQFNSKWFVSFETQFVPFNYRYSTTQSFTEEQSYQKLNRSTFTFLGEVAIGFGIGYKI